jgi:hydroxypyruvate isomerase
MGVFVASRRLRAKPTFAGTDKKDAREQVLAEDIDESVDVARARQRPMGDGRPRRPRTTRREPSTTRPPTGSSSNPPLRCCEILEPHGPGHGARTAQRVDEPPRAASSPSIPQAYQICRAVNSPRCKILDDLYHQQITEGNLIPNIDEGVGRDRLLPGRRQRPAARNPTPARSTTSNVFRHIRKRKGFRASSAWSTATPEGGKDGEARRDRRLPGGGPGVVVGFAPGLGSGSLLPG